MTLDQTTSEVEPLAGDALPDPIREDAHANVLRFLLHGFYDLTWGLAVVLGVPWLAYRSIKSRAFYRMVRERLGRGVRGEVARFTESRPRVLVHGVSVGEVKAAQSLIAGLQAQGADVVVSTTTDTGTEVARSTYGSSCAIVRFPADPSPIVKAFLRKVAPDLIVLIELEIWPNFLRHANRAGIPMAVVNGRITPSSFRRYRHFRHLVPQFDRLSAICVQDETYAGRFRSLSGQPDRVVVTGNIKIDGLEVGRRQVSPELRATIGPQPGQKVVVAGSTHDPEEQMVVRAWREGAPGARLIVVPRHPERATGIRREIEASLGLRVQRLTELRTGAARPDPGLPVLVDTIGELEQVYALADLVFVGGSLVPHGGQNMLEPAAQGLAVLYGPHVDNFLAEASLLEGAEASRRVADEGELARCMGELLDDGAVRQAMGEQGSLAVASQKGATRATLAILGELCPLIRAAGKPSGPPGSKDGSL